MNQTKKTWQQYWLMLQYYKFPAIATFLLTIILTITAVIKVERTYTVNSTIKLESANKEVIDSLEATTTNNNQNIEPANSEQVADIEKDSETFSKQVFEQLKTENNSLETVNYEQFVKQLEIKNDSVDDTIKITYSGKDIDSSKLVVNSVIESYKNQQADIELSNLAKIKDQFNQQLASADKDSKEIAKKIKAILTKYDRNILESKPEYLTNKIKEIESKIASAKSKIKEVDSKINSIKLKLGLDYPQNAIAGQVAGNSEQQKLFQQLQDIETQLIQEGARFSSQNPVIINLQAEKSRLEAQIRNQNLSSQQYLSVNQNNYSITEDTEQLVNYEAEKQSLSTQIDSWEIDKAQYQKDQAIAPEIKQQYQELLANSKKAKDKHNKLLNRYQQLEVFSEDNVTNIKIINPTKVKNSLASWNKEIIAFSGVGLGFILALATIVALESRNPTLKNISEISELFNSKILGEIPNLRKSDFHLSHRSDPVVPERFVLEAPYSVACEAYNIVYDNLVQTRPDQVIKLISVVSSSTGEGKSTFIANLAALTTQLGKKVLIIDANPQTPRQKAIWKIDNNLGLTDILKKDAEFADVVQSPSLNLNVITAGSMVEDYLSLWESASRSEFISRIREEYDLVLFDTPAIALSADALKISQFIDGMILVGRIGFTNPKISLETKELIKKSHQEILGIVVNDKFNS